jgi:hypothetical protein
MTHRDCWHRGDTRTAEDQQLPRAQSEPLAALLAVAVVCGAISLYAGVIGGVAAESGSDRELAAPTADAVKGYLTGGGAIDADTSVTAAIRPNSLPDGRSVSITVTVVADDGRIREVGTAAFDDAGTPVRDPNLGTSQRASRPVPVRLQPGDVRPGRLVVEVAK